MYIFFHRFFTTFPLGLLTIHIALDVIFIRSFLTRFFFHRQRKKGLFSLPVQMCNYLGVMNHSVLIAHVSLFFARDTP